MNRGIRPATILKKYIIVAGSVPKQFWQNSERPGSASQKCLLPASTREVGLFQFTGLAPGTAYPIKLINFPILIQNKSLS